MARPLIATKLFVPKRRADGVSRPRLLERLRGGADRRLILVSAPAGFGKTTLLAEWIVDQPADGRVAWLSLDSTDNDLGSFWTHAVHALRTAVPGIGSTAVDLLASSAAAELALGSLLNELAEVAHGVWLVLDDYHVIDAPQVGESMAFFLDHLPVGVHVVISTRADPVLPLPRWRVRGELTELRATDLRFTPNETTSYLNEVARLGLPAADLAVLARRTEGWIAALQLAALSLRGRDDVSGFISRFAGDDRYIVDYLVEEVLGHLPDDVGDFLSRTSILSRLTGPLCDAVTGRADGADTLESLERANLFVVALDDQREWYRYHHLFADVLAARLTSEQSGQVAQLHDRASRWYERHGMAEEAVRHAVDAVDFDRATDLIAAAVPAIRRDRQDAMLLGWLDQLPAEVVRRNPVLNVFAGYQRLLSGDLPGAELRFDQAERTLLAIAAGETEPPSDSEALRALPATVAVYRASIAQARGDVAGTERHSRRALDIADPADHLSRGAAAGFLGLAAWAHGDVHSALGTFGQAVSSLHAAGNLIDELSSTVILADMWLVAGRPAKARGLYERALQQAAPSSGLRARATADLHVGLSEIDLEADDLESAAHRLRTAETLGVNTIPTESRYRWFVAKARLAVAEADSDRAGQLLDEAEQLYHPGFFPDVRPISAMRARIWIGAGRLSEAGDWARDRGVSVHDHAEYLHEFDHLTLVRLLLAQHRQRLDTAALEQAGQLLDRWHVAAETFDRAGSLVEIGLLQALTEDAGGYRSQAVESLVRTLSLAPEPDGYLRLFLDEGASMASLLRAALLREESSSGLGEATGTLRRLTAAFDIPVSGEPPTSAPPILDPLSGRELQVLRLLDSELTGPQIARELFVSHNTVRTHTKHIFTKLDVTSRRAAVRRARERGLI